MVLSSKQKKEVSQLVLHSNLNLKKDMLKNDSRVRDISINQLRYFTKKSLDHIYPVLNFMPHSKKKLKVLDIGMGIGHITFSIKELFGHDVYAIEHPGPWYLKNAFFKQSCKKYDIKLSLLDITKSRLPFENNFFDVLVFTEVLEHINPFFRKKILDEIDRVIKNQGTLIVSTPNFLSLVHRIKFLLGIPVEYDISDEPEYSGVYGHIREYTVYELKKILIKREYTITGLKMENYSYGARIFDLINGISTAFMPFMKNNIILSAKKMKK